MLSKETYLKYRLIFENNYIENINKGKHDLGFVNLYDIKNNIKFFNEFIYLYSFDKTNILFSNIVWLIDKRKRFIVKGNKPVIKIKIDLNSNSLIDLWSERFNKIQKSYEKF